MYSVYILRSQKNGRYYIGSTNALSDRLHRHNTGEVTSTKRYLPWVVVYTESYTTRQEAYRREMKIKSFKSGEAFRKLLKKS